MHQGLVNPINQAVNASAIEDAVCQNLDSRFRWHAIFDLMFLHKLVCSFFEDFQKIDDTLRKELIYLKQVLQDQGHPTTLTILYLLNTGQKTKEWSDTLYKVWLGPGLEINQL